MWLFAGCDHVMNGLGRGGHDEVQDIHCGLIEGHLQLYARQPETLDSIVHETVLQLVHIKQERS